MFRTEHMFFIGSMPPKARRIDEMANAECPECAGSVSLAANAEVGEILSCPDCGNRLEVRSVSPPQLSAAPKVEEDWGE